MKKIYLLMSMLISTVTANAQEEIKIFPKNFFNEKREYVEKEETREHAGRSAICVTDVATPTITIYKAKRPAANPKTIIVSPGGGYNILSMDKEGRELCQILNENGYDAVLLKYRVPRREGREKHEAALEDLQRTISTIRAKGNKYGICSDNIGVVGFSAGAHLSVMACCSDRIYEKIDKIDEKSCTPDFCALVYPAYLSGANFALSPEVKITEKTPKTFIVQAIDDTKYVDSSLFYYYALKEAKIPSELHIFANGGHGNGVWKMGKDFDSWSDRYIEWLNSL